MVIRMTTVSVIFQDSELAIGIGGGQKPSTPVGQQPIKRMTLLKASSLTKKPWNRDSAGDLSKRQWFGKNFGPLVRMVASLQTFQRDVAP